MNAQLKFGQFLFTLLTVILIVGLLHLSGLVSLTGLLPW